MLSGMEELDASATAGAWVRQARRLADLSQRELAERAGLRRQVVERIEAGSVSPRLSTLLTLLRAAGCHLALRPGPQPVGTQRPGLRDRAQRHYPAHLDVREVDRFGSWWGDWQLLSTLAPKAWGRAPRQRPDHTFDLARWRRDDRRREDGYPPS